MVLFIFSTSIKVFIGQQTESFVLQWKQRWPPPGEVMTSWTLYSYFKALSPSLVAHKTTDTGFYCCCCCCCFDSKWCYCCPGGTNGKERTSPEWRTRARENFVWVCVCVFICVFICAAVNISVTAGRRGNSTTITGAGYREEIWEIKIPFVTNMYVVLGHRSSELLLQGAETWLDYIGVLFFCFYTTWLFSATRNLLKSNKCFFRKMLCNQTWL